MQGSLANSWRPTSPPRAGSFARLARKLVLARLELLSTVRIRFEDPLGNHTVGKGDQLLKISVRDTKFWRRIVRGGLLTTFEEYLDGTWTTDDLPELLNAFVRERDAMDVMNSGPARFINQLRRFRLALRRNTTQGSRRNIQAHYDLSNAFFQLWLDPTMTYSAGVFTHPEATLEEASNEKLERACRKLELQPGMHVVEIGTGWGSMAMHLARHHDVHVTTTTISKEQASLARKRIKEAGLEHRITLLESDYRSLEGNYDRLVSIEMIEAVGHEYLETFLAKCADLLKPEGMALIQAITVPDDRYERMRRSEDFIKRYVFPGSCLLSMRRILDTLARRGEMSLYGMEDITIDYARTLAAWRENFHAAGEAIRALGYDERFVRMWDLYLAYCEAGFRERLLGSVQLRFARPAFRDRGYRPAWAPVHAATSS